MTLRTLPSISIALVTVLFSPLAQADATIEMQEDEHGKTLVQVKGKMVRLSEAGDPVYTLYDKHRNVMITVNDNKKIFTELDLDVVKSQLAQVRKQMDAQRAEMQKQMASLPPEQQRMVKQQMPAYMLDGKMRTMTITSKPTGTSKVKGFPCRMYDLYEGKERVAEACIADGADVQISRKDYEALLGMWDFMQKMAKMTLPFASAEDYPDPLIMSELKGLPLKMKDFRQGQTFSVTRISNKTLDASLFNGYKNYQRQSMQEME